MSSYKEHFQCIGKWIVHGIPGDLRSAIVGALFATAGTYVYAALNDDAPLQFSAITDAKGFGRPLKLLSSVVEEGEEKAQFVFDPPELRDVLVCEFSHIKASSHVELMLNYLSKYPTCFSVAQVNETKYRIFISPSNLDIRKQGDEFFCKCL